jgi:hypothetical protein
LQLVTSAVTDLYGSLRAIESCLNVLPLGSANKDLGEDAAAAGG